MREYYQGLYRPDTSEPPGRTLHLLDSHPEITVKYSRRSQHFIFPRCVRSALPPSCMHACVECVSISVSAYHAVPPPPPPAWRGVGRRWTASTHSLGLCISSRSDLRQTLTRFLCTLNKTPITALVSTVTGFHSLPWAVAWMADVCLNMPLCLQRRGASVCMYVPLCINHLT